MKPEESYEETEKLQQEQEIKEEREHQEFVKGLTTSLRKIDLPFAKREEFFVYLDISLDCLERSLKEKFFLEGTVTNHAKQRIDVYFNKNKYVNIMIGIPCKSFYSFSNYIFYDSGINYDDYNINTITRRIQKEMNFNIHMSAEELKECSRRIDEAHEKYKIDSNLVDPYPYIIAEKHNDMILDFLTDKQVYDNLFNDAKIEIEKQQETIYKNILATKRIYFLKRLSEIYSVAIKESGLITNWYMLLHEYIEKIEDLIPEDKSVESIKPKVAMLLFQSVFNHLDIDTKDESFFRLMSRITNIGYDATVKYLTDSQLMCSDDAYAKNGIETIELLKKLRIREPEFKKGEPDNPQDNLNPIIDKLAKGLKDLKEVKDLNKDRLERLISKCHKSS